MKSLITIFLFFNFLVFIGQTNYTSFVNPFVGTGGTGHTFPGAVLPFGMVQLSPDTRVDGSWEGCSGYYYSDTVIYGFSHTHLSGTGVSDYGDVLVMPTTNKNSFKNAAYATGFSHLKEKASAGYYSVTLKNNIQAELTATKRVGIHRYTFPASDTGSIIIDLKHRDKLLSSSFTVIDSVTVIGSRVSEAWASEQHIYFIMKFSKPIAGKEYFTANKKPKRPDEKEMTVGAFLKFQNNDNKPLLIKVGISQTSTDGAKLNLEAEATHWDFDKYKSEAESAWEKELSKIEIQSRDEEKKAVFYTALYHCFMHPSLAGDVDGKYRGRDMKIHQAVGYTPYTVFSLWDTFRALHPLLTIIDKKRTSDFINTFLQQYKDGGRLPMWELSSNETNCMIGFHSVSVITDAAAKNIGGFDKNLAYEAMVSAASYTDLGTPSFNKNYYLQIEDEHESVSKVLEYAYDNWCIAQMAKKLNKKSDYLKFSKRSLAYKNVYDNTTGFMRPRKNGNWYSPFEPREVNNYFTEANSWQYSFFVPHDVSGLINLMGSENNFEKKLDELFSTSNQTVGRTQADITGLIGQYAHGNEPSHHMAYLYNYIGKPHKTQERVHEILTKFYKNDPDGLIGNEDCGQMSAWYVLSSMGFYQVCPGKPEYTIGTPLFDEVKINLENGKTFKISRHGKLLDGELEYIESVLLNGKPFTSTVLSHTTITNGGSIEFTMNVKKDDKNVFGKNVTSRPSSSIADNFLLQIPVIISPIKLTDTEKTITIKHPNPNAKIFYTTDGSTPNAKSKLYTNSFSVDTSLVIKALAILNSDTSSVIAANVFKKSNTWKIRIKDKYNSQYDAGGDDGVIDGQYATTNWKSGGWQGYQSKDFVCIIDMEKIKPVQTITSSYLQDTRSWIIFPKSVEYEVSEDGISFIPFATIENGIPAEDYSIQKRIFYKDNKNPVNARYVKVKAVNFGKLPEWHQGKGGDAFIFIDEIEIK